MSDPDLPVATKWTACHLPESDPNYYSFAIHAESSGKGRWAIRHAGSCLSRTGQWVWEPQPSSRTDRWLRDHRFSENEAKGLISALAATVVVNGVTAAEWVARSEVGA